MIEATTTKKYSKEQFYSQLPFHPVLVSLFCLEWVGGGEGGGGRLADMTDLAE